MPRPDRRVASQAAHELLAEVSWRGTPVDPIAIATSLGIVVQASAKLGGSFSGCLMQSGQIFGILFTTTIANEGFKRFTVGHELGHFRLPEHRATLLRDGASHYSQSNFTSNDWFEVEADTFAAALLMPEDVFRAEIRRRPLGIPAVKALADTFSTSLTSTAIRYAQLTPDPVAIVVSEGRSVRYCFVSPCLDRVRGVFLRHGSPLPPKSATARFNRDLENVRQAREVEDRSHMSVWFDSVSRDFEVNEDVIGLGAYGRTLTVLHATELPPEDGEDEED